METSNFESFPTEFALLPTPASLRSIRQQQQQHYCRQRYKYPTIQQARLKLDEKTKSSLPQDKCKNLCEPNNNYLPNTTTTTTMSMSSAAVESNRELPATYAPTEMSCILPTRATPTTTATSILVSVARAKFDSHSKRSHPPLIRRPEELGENEYVVSEREDEEKEDDKVDYNNEKRHKNGITLLLAAQLCRRFSAKSADLNRLMLIFGLLFCVFNLFGTCIQSSRGK